MANNIYFYQTNSPEAVSKVVFEKISDHLNRGESVLWLVSGGSAIGIAVETARSLSVLPSVTNLTVSLVDERYGLPEHKDSNWAQLLAAGFQLKGANLRPLLDGSDPEQTNTRFNDFIGGSLRDFKYRIALLGLGIDGHTAGILPNSHAVDSVTYADLYQAPDFQRITLTPLGISILNEVVVFAQGRAKLEALEDLSKDLPIGQQPAQAIKTVSNIGVYSDLVGEKI